MTAPQATVAPSTAQPASTAPRCVAEVVVMARALLALARPRQWVKNVLVAAAPVAAGSWMRPAVALHTGFAFGCFTAASVGCYVVNDVRDLERDRWHPTKRTRPLAAGRLQVRTALAFAAGCLALALIGSLIVAPSGLSLVVATYVVVSLGYSMGLKHLPVLEILVVASGFVLRALAGAAATGIPPSRWFLGVVCAGALMVALAKRSAELALEGSAQGHRPSLHFYTVRGLWWARQVAVAALIGCYLGWVISRVPEQRLPAAVSFVALLVVLVRFAKLGNAGRVGAPEELVVQDKVLLSAAVLWLGFMIWSTAVV